MTSKNHCISPVEINRDIVLSKCSYFVDVQLWPLQSALNPGRWLENFEEREMDYALHLLNSFLYFSDQLTNEMFVAAFQGLSNTIRRQGDSFLSAQAAWRSFVDSLIVTPISGEVPKVTDSGNFFARKARQQLGIDERRILSPEETLQLLVTTGPCPVIFVDDFVGSGNQFLKTWQRRINLEHSICTSFKDFSSVRGSQFLYCPLLCTEYGYSRLQKECPEVLLSPTHVLSSKYSALDDNSLIWPPNLRATAVDFLYRASARAGIPDNSGGVNDWRGFHKLGLTVAFAHSVPDATLPIFYWEEKGWKPLIPQR